MSTQPGTANEREAEAAFSKQSSVFDKLYNENTIISYKRKRVREHVERLLKPSSNILELNAGTGEDAIYFAAQGHSVHATDISEGMQKILVEKIRSAGVQNYVSREVCSFNKLAQLNNKGPYDLIFSNFAGLNCTNDLEDVLKSFAPLLQPQGIVTLVILPKFCLWETLLIFKGKFRTATRRFFTKKGRAAHIEGLHFRCWYYNPSFVIRKLRSQFRLLSLEGLCTFVPPSYIEHFAEKHPGLFSSLKKREEKLKSSWPWRSVGDYYIISLQKN